MREPPAYVATADLLAAVSAHWRIDASTAEHLPVGFGAHHWRVGDLFVTLDRLEPKRTAAALEAAYAGAAALAEGGLDVALAALATATGAYTVSFAGGALSATPLLDGGSPDHLDPSWTEAALHRLHRAEVPAGLPRWGPVGPDLADETAELTRRPWGPGPFADPARDLVADRLAELAHWTARYHHLAEVARTRPWVATHGEPHADNQLVTTDGRHLLIDWESLKLAPPERDLRVLADAGLPVSADPEMLELFDLEWRLDEIQQYAAWFAAPHSGTADDRIAFGGLRHELTRA